MARVLRLAPGTRVVAVDPGGRQWIVRLDDVGRRGARGLVEEELAEDAEPPVDLILAQGLPKGGGKMELVVQKGTEIGVTRFLPVLCQRSVPRPDGGAAARLERWRRVAREAAEQAGRRLEPMVEPLVSFAAAVGQLGRCDLFLLPWEEERSLSLRSVLAEFAVRLRGAVSPGGGGPAPAGTRPSVGVLIGPEGGLAPEEVAQAVAAGARVVSLGPRLLRTETAGLVVAVAVLYEFGGLERSTGGR